MPDRPDVQRSFLRLERARPVSLERLPRGNVFELLQQRRVPAVPFGYLLGKCRVFPLHTLPERHVLGFRFCGLQQLIPLSGPSSFKRLPPGYVLQLYDKWRMLAVLAWNLLGDGRVIPLHILPGRDVLDDSRRFV